MNDESPAAPVEEIPAALEPEVVSEAPGADEPEVEETEAAPAAAAAPPAEASKKAWYVVKVASGREESIKAAIERKIKMENLEGLFGQIVIPVERITEVKKVRETKNGEKITKEKRVVKEKKKFPGYLMAEVEWTADLQAVFRDTSGVGYFVGTTRQNKPGSTETKPPAPMSDKDVRSMLYGMLPEDQKGSNKPKGPEKIKLDFEVGDKVRIREGAFSNFEGEVTLIVVPKEAGETPKVTVVVLVLGRKTPLELEYWQVDRV